MPGESKLPACGESAGVEGALHHVQAIALRFCLWKAEYVHLYQRVGRAAGKGSECLQQFHKSCSPSGASRAASLTSPVQPVEVCRVGSQSLQLRAGRARGRWQTTPSCHKAPQLSRTEGTSELWPCALWLMGNRIVGLRANIVRKICGYGGLLLILGVQVHH